MAGARPAAGCTTRVAFCSRDTPQWLGPPAAVDSRCCLAAQPNLSTTQQEVRRHTGQCGA
jgi:hypothetical protein